MSGTRTFIVKPSRSDRFGEGFVVVDQHTGTVVDFFPVESDAQTFADDLNAKCCPTCGRLP